MQTDIAVESRAAATILQTSDTKIAAAMLAAGCELIDKDVSKSLKGYINGKGAQQVHILIQDTKQARAIAKAWRDEQGFSTEYPDDPQSHIMRAFYQLRQLGYTESREFLKQYRYDAAYIAANPEDARSYIMAALFHYANLLKAIKTDSVGYHTVLRKGKDVHFIKTARPA